MNDITAQAKMTPLAAAALVARRGGDADTSLTIMAQICLLVCGVTALAVSAHIKIPFYPVPLTMQTLVVLLIGMSYGSRLGGATVLAYLGAGAAGAPVFAGGAGIIYLAGPTGGYLAGFFVAAITLGFLAERGWARSFVTTALSMVIGTALIYACGVTWLSQLIGFEKAVSFGMLPFLYGDALKLVIASLGMPFAWSFVSKMMK